MEYNSTMKETEQAVPLEIVKKHLDINFGFEYKTDEIDSSLQAVLVANPTSFHRILIIDESAISKKQHLYLNIHAASHILLGHHLKPPFMGIIEPKASEHMEFRSANEEEWHRQANILTLGILNKRIDRYWREIWEAIHIDKSREEEEDIRADSMSLVKLLGDYNYHQSS